ncbi:S41 family peptidase [Halorhodospira neutriphila]|uniref:S41 family peptidase n=1 Tax=Halorhodospira neutriphila TaxID=168379 RepID=UPI0030844BDB
MIGGLLGGGELGAEARDPLLPRYPSISPDGSQLVFSGGGDLWRVSAEGGNATRLTGHRLDDLYSSWSPDGRWILFSSLRDGYLNLWRMRRDGTQLRQVTYSDRYVRHPDYTEDADGEPVVTFSSYREGDVARAQRPYRVSPRGGETRRLHDAFGAEPRLSPDGRYVAFTRGGAYHGWNRRHYRGPGAMDVWLYDRDREDFERLTRWEGDDGRAEWAGERTLLFLSDRELDTVNLYHLDLAADNPRPQRLTAFEGRDVLHFDVARDGSRAVLQAWGSLYTLELDEPGAEAQRVPLRAGGGGRNRYRLQRVDREVTEAALSPGGEVMATIAYGRVYVRHMAEHSPTRAVTPPSATVRHRDLSWSPDGLRLYFTSDVDGTASIYQARVALTRREINGRGGRLSVERARALAPPGGQAAWAQGTEPGSGAAAQPVAAAASASPWQRVVPAVAQGASPGGDASGEGGASPDAATADTAGSAEGSPAWADPKRWRSAVRFTVEPLVQTPHNDRQARPSPDGRRIAFRRGRGDLVVRRLGDGRERTLVEGWDRTIEWRWSPDGRYIAYAQKDLDFSTNIFVVPADGSREPVNITRHPRNDRNPRWSADGRILTFRSNRGGESYDLYRVHLDAALERYTRRDLDRYYRRAKEAAAEREPLPVTLPGRDGPEGPAERGDGAEAPTLELDSAWRRVERVTRSPVDEYANAMTPAGDRYIFNVSGEGLMAMRWDGAERERLGPEAEVQHLSLTGERVVYVADGRPGVVDLADGDHRRPAINDRIRIDRRAEFLQKFREAARAIEEGFYRPDLKGLDWDALVERYEGLIRRVRTTSEFTHVTNRLMGELAASHTGVSDRGPASGLREPSGRLGIRHERVRLDDGRPGYRVTELVPRGPAERGPAPLRVGDVITAVEGRGLAPRETLMRRLRGRVGEELLITFRRPGAHGGDAYHTLITPVGFSELAQLRYDAFRRERRQKVEALSDGRLGYIHIKAMNEASLEAFQGHLYAAAEGKEGLIIDVRNNGGGHTTDRVLTSILAAEHAYTLPAGADPEAVGHYPQGRLHAPRYTQPINMVANAESYSNAEILAHAFKTLERGRLVGEQTYGGVISAARHTLIDGATVRLPFRGWYLPDGTDMEQHGAVPDLRVRQRPADEAAGRDPQLRAAVEDLLARLGPPGPG